MARSVAIPAPPAIAGETSGNLPNVSRIVPVSPFTVDPHGIATLTPQETHRWSAHAGTGREEDPGLADLARPARLTSGVAGRITLNPMTAIRFLKGIGPAAMLLAVSALRAAEPVPALPDIEEVLRKHVEASGGEALMRSVTSRSLKGVITAELFGTAQWEMLAKAPNKRLVITEVPGLGKMLEGFDGTVAWSSTPMTGTIVREGDEAAKAAREADFHLSLRYRELFPGLRVVRQEAVGGEAVWVTESRPTPNAIERLYFGQQSGQLLRHVSEMTSDAGRSVTSAVFADFRKVNGEPVPHQIDLEIEPPGGVPMKLQLKLTEVRQSIEIDDARFTRPER